MTDRLSVMSSRLIAANGMLYDGCEHLLTEGVLLPATDAQVRRDIDGLLTKHAQRELPPEKPKKVAKEPKPPKEKKVPAYKECNTCRGTGTLIGREEGRPVPIGPCPDCDGLGQIKEKKPRAPRKAKPPVPDVPES